MIFVRTALGALLVACLVALAGLGYRLWDVQRQLGARVKALEARVTSTQADMEALRASFDQRVTFPARQEGVETDEVDEVGSETR
ncbi:MAG TPA: hypothetical protein VMY37_37220 [Thermoguttaceae bacterium]|nr:hypothetical protein [Thermoguttaceae bacterium]